MPDPLATASTDVRAQRPVKLLEMVRMTWPFTEGLRGKMALAVAVGAAVAVAEASGVALIAPVVQILADKPHFNNTPILGSLVRALGGFSPSDRVAIVGAALVAAVLTRGGLHYWSLCLNQSIAIATRTKLIGKAHRACLDASMEFINQFPHGRLAQVLKGHPGRVGVLIQNATNLVIGLIVGLIYLILMAILSWQITLFSVIFFGVLATGYQAIFRRRLARAGHDLMEAAATQDHRFYEFYNGLKIIKQLSAQERSFRLLKQSFSAMEVVTERQTMLLAISSPFFHTATGVFVGLVLVFNAVAVPDASSSWLAEILIFIVIASRLSGPVQAINQARSGIVNTYNSVRELDRALSAFRRHVDADGSKAYAGLGRGISFEGVGFHYRGAPPAALADVSLDIPERAFVAFVGPSGAGKTTMIDLLTRIYRPTAGQIRVGGVPLDELEIATFRRKMGLVPQDPFLLHDSVLENIRFGRDIGDETIREAARQADADEFIRRLPKGYDEVIGDRGLRLSGGQRQRLGIARALAGDPDLIVLDEATSNLDSLSERAIQETIRRLRGHKTVIAVAHRLATVQQADQLYVFDGGRVVQQGTHAELASVPGIYRDLVSSQLLD